MKDFQIVKAQDSENIIVSWNNDDLITFQSHIIETENWKTFVATFASPHFDFRIRQTLVNLLYGRTNSEDVMLLKMLNYILKVAAEKVPQVSDQQMELEYQAFATQASRLRSSISNILLLLGVIDSVEIK